MASAASSSQISPGNESWGQLGKSRVSGKSGKGDKGDEDKKDDDKPKKLKKTATWKDPKAKTWECRHVCLTSPNSLLSNHFVSDLLSQCQVITRIGLNLQKVRQALWYEVPTIRWKRKSPLRWRLFLVDLNWDGRPCRGWGWGWSRCPIEVSFSVCRQLQLRDVIGVSLYCFSLRDRGIMDSKVLLLVAWVWLSLDRAMRWFPFDTFVLFWVCCPEIEIERRKRGCLYYFHLINNACMDFHSISPWTYYPVVLWTPPTRE